MTMNLALKPVAFALFVAASQPVGLAYAQPPSKPAAAPAASPVIATKSPEGWIVYDKVTYTPIVDDVSRHLDAAHKAFAAKDDKKAAAEMRVVAAELNEQAARAESEGQSTAKEDEARLAVDARLERDASRHLRTAAQKVSAVAAALDNGKIQSDASFERAIDKAVRADIERRWLVVDVKTWYPASEEPQRHFSDAAAAYARKDYQAAANDIRKAVGYLRLEAGRATGAAKEDLDSSVARLDRLANLAEKGALKDERAMTRDFARAEHALALEHRANAIDSWTRTQYDRAGYDLKAAAHGLESAAGWIGGEAKASASTTAADARRVGDKLVSGATWTRDEVATGFDALGSAIDTLGHKIGDPRKASPFDAGA